MEKWTTFRLVEIRDKIVWFSGLTMIREGDKIKLFIEIPEKEERNIEELSYWKSTF